MKGRTLALMTGMATIAALGARAQSSAPQTPAAEASPPSKPAASEPAKTKTVEGIIVSAPSQNGMRSAIDRRSYGIATVLVTSTGSIADALRNIPSVDVDPQGNVSLRGDSHVTIMVDGKPSGQFSGPGGAQSLQAAPASSFERVEVMTNPSAEFSPEGSAGIINLITKKIRKPGASGSIRAALGDHGRRQAGVTGAYNSDKVTLSGEAYGRRDTQPVEALDSRELLDGDGHLLSANQTQSQPFSHFDSWGGRLGADFDPDGKTRLSAEARFNEFTIETLIHQQFQGEDATNTVNQRFVETGRGTLGRGDGALEASLRKTFAGDEHSLNINIVHEQIHEERDGALHQAVSLPDVATLFFEDRTLNTLNRTEGKADYSAPIPNNGRLKAGYDLRVDDNRYDTVGVRGSTEATAEADPNQTNLFLYKQVIDAAYASYEQPFGAWTVQGGLRLEEADVRLNQVTTAQTHDTRYFRAYPTFHVAYNVNDQQQISLSYSRRIQRPNPEDLNAFRIQIDALNFRAGNPNLQLQTTDSFEAAYQYKSGGTYYLATLYYRQNEHGVTDVVTPLPNDAFLTTKANLSDSKAAGLELVASARLTKTLTYNVSTNAYWNQIDANSSSLQQLVDFAVRRSAFEVSGRGTLNWQPTANDALQVSMNLIPKRLTPQGYAEPAFQDYIGYRHKFREDLFAVVTVQNPFNEVRFAQVIDTPSLRDHNVQHIFIRGVFFGFTRTLGGHGKQPNEPSLNLGT